MAAAVEAIRTVGPQVSMEQMAAQAGVTKPILYRHFGDRDGLLEAIGEYFAHQVFARLGAALNEAEPEEILWRTIDAYLAFLDEDPQVYAFVTATALTTPLARRASAMIDVIAQQVARAIGDQLRAAGLDAGPAEPYAFGIVGMVREAGDWWLRSKAMSRDALTTYLCRLLWYGFDGLDQAASAPAGVARSS